MGKLTLAILLGAMAFGQYIPPGGGGSSSCSGDINTGCSQVIATHLVSPLPLNQGGIGATSLAAAGIQASLPLTTLGDILYENATPAPARLAGNTTSTLNILTQTGTGSVSAAPAWSTAAGAGIAALASSNTFTTNGAVSTPSQAYNGTIFTGGTSTTTKPFVLFEPSGTTSTGWNTAGTQLGFNTTAGTDVAIDIQMGGSSVLALNGAGQIFFKGNTDPPAAAIYDVTAGGHFLLMEDNNTWNPAIQIIGQSSAAGQGNLGTLKGAVIVEIGGGNGTATPDASSKFLVDKTSWTGSAHTDFISLQIDNSSNLTIPSAAGHFWTSSGDATGTVDSTICRSAAGILEVGTSACNSSGQMILANLGIGITTPLSDFQINGPTNPAREYHTGHATDATNDTGGVVAFLSHNASGNRQLMFADTASVINSAQTGFNVTFGGGTTVTINGLSTDGSTAMGMTVGANFVTNILQGKPISLKGLPVITGSTFIASGCSNSTLVGGASAGSYTSGTTGTCTVIVTMGNNGNGSASAASNGLVCSVWDVTTPADLQNMTASTTTTATFSGTTLSGDVIKFACVGY